jgi:hypothetical protein
MFLLSFSGNTKVTLLEQVLAILPVQMSSTTVFGGVRVAESLF